MTECFPSLSSWDIDRNDMKLTVDLWTSRVGALDDSIEFATQTSLLSLEKSAVTEDSKNEGKWERRIGEEMVVRVPNPSNGNDNWLNGTWAGERNGAGH